MLNIKDPISDYSVSDNTRYIPTMSPVKYSCLSWNSSAVFLTGSGVSRPLLTYLSWHCRGNLYWDLLAGLLRYLMTVPLLRNFLTLSGWYVMAFFVRDFVTFLSVDSGTLRGGHLLTVLLGDLGAGLLRDSLTLLPRNRAWDTLAHVVRNLIALFFGNLITVLLGNLNTGLLRNILTLLFRNLYGFVDTGLDRSLLAVLTLRSICGPCVICGLALLMVVGCALLPVLFSVLCPALALVGGVALLFLCSCALLLVRGGTLRLIFSGTLFLVLSVVDSGTNLIFI